MGTHAKHLQALLRVAIAVAAALIIVVLCVGLPSPFSFKFAGSTASAASTAGPNGNQAPCLAGPPALETVSFAADPTAARRRPPQHADDPACARMVASPAYKRSTTDDSLPPLLYRNNEGSGLADNFAGSVTVFYMALALGRRLYLSYDILDLGCVTPAFDNWRWTDAASLPPMDGHYLEITPEALTPTVLENVPAAVRTNRGVTVHSYFTQTRLGVFLKTELGLTAETAFACAMRALYRPTPSLFAAPGVAAAYHTLSTTRKQRIGVHVRTGDGYFAYKTLSAFPAFVQESHRKLIEVHVRCALLVASDPNGAVLFLVTDSLAVRHAFRQLALPAGVEGLMATDGPVDHVSPLQTATHSNASSILAVAEHTLLSMVDTWIVWHGSGFGVTAAMRSGRANGQMYRGDTCEQLSLNWVGTARAGV